MLYECVHQVTTVGDANKMAHQTRGQQLNFSYCMWAFFWLDRIELTMDTFMKNAPEHASRDVKPENLPHCAPCAFEVFEGTAW